MCYILIRARSCFGVSIHIHTLEFPTYRLDISTVVVRQFLAVLFAALRILAAMLSALWTTERTHNLIVVFSTRTYFDRRGREPDCVPATDSHSAY